MPCPECGEIHWEACQTKLFEPDDHEQGYLHPEECYLCGMQQWPSGSAGGKRRFEAAAVPKRIGVIVVLVSVALVAGGWLSAAILPAGLHKALFPVFMILFVAGYGIWLAVALRVRTLPLDVDGHHLSVDEGRGGVFPLAGAVLGPWRQAGIGVTAGTVLHLSDGARFFRVGGRDHRPSPRLRLDAPPAEGVDVYLSSADFDALLALLPAVAIAMPTAAPLAVVRCPLLPNPASPRRTFAMMAPWLGTIVVVTVLSGVLDTFGVFDSATGQAIATPFIFAILLGGIVLTAVVSARRSAAFELELDDREIRLRNPKTGRIVASTPRHAIAPRRWKHHVSARNMSFEYPAIGLMMPNGDEITIGVYDSRFGWSDTAARGGAPRYIVGVPDWYSLVERCGVRGVMTAQEGLGAG